MPHPSGGCWKQVVHSVSGEPYRMPHPSGCCYKQVVPLSAVGTLTMIHPRLAGGKLYTQSLQVDLDGEYNPDENNMDKILHAFTNILPPPPLRQSGRIPLLKTPFRNIKGTLASEMYGRAEEMSQCIHRVLRVGGIHGHKNT